MFLKIILQKNSQQLEEDIEVQTQNFPSNERMTEGQTLSENEESILEIKQTNNRPQRKRKPPKELSEFQIHHKKQKKSGRIKHNDEEADSACGNISYQQNISEIKQEGSCQGGDERGDAVLEETIIENDKKILKRTYDSHINGIESLPCLSESGGSPVDSLKCKALSLDNKEAFKDKNPDISGIKIEAMDDRDVYSSHANSSVSSKQVTNDTEGVDKTSRTFPAKNIQGLRAQNLDKTSTSSCNFKFKL